MSLVIIVCRYDSACMYMYMYMSIQYENKCLIAENWKFTEEFIIYNVIQKKKKRKEKKNEYKWDKHWFANTRLSQKAVHEEETF